ncbi:YidH family protein [Nocardioides sp. LHG3406-4]|uniref:YidH family protein n=1 Tax=Nocardioides sp. LHG3406-4 TaxID=2804575 RepID=UPI003CF737D6
MIEPDYRFTLANERTLLAYERTTIGLVAAAVAVVHLIDGAGSMLLAVALLIAGAVAAVGGYFRFRAVDHAIRRGDPLPANPAVHLLACAIMVCLVVATLWIVL